jgi:hypothetical protein
MIVSLLRLETDGEDLLLHHQQEAMVLLKPRGGVFVRGALV